MTEFHVESITHTNSVNVSRGTEYTSVLEQVSKNGLTWTWCLHNDYTTTAKANTDDKYVYLSWKFEWDSEQILGWTGEITMDHHNANTGAFSPKTFNVELTGPGLFYVEKQLVAAKSLSYYTSTVKHELKMKTISEKDHETELFRPVRNSAHLVVEGKCIHVDKEFLAYHSDYFRALFFSEFKEKELPEIPIEDVDFKDFGSLLRVIDLKPTFPTDDTAEKLIEYANRFLMPGVVSHVEYYLLKLSEFRLSRMLYLADKYKLTSLFNKCITLIKSAEHIKIIHKSSYIDEISDKTKAALLKVMCSF